MAESKKLTNRNNKLERNMRKFKDTHIPRAEVCREAKDRKR